MKDKYDDIFEKLENPEAIEDILLTEADIGNIFRKEMNIFPMELSMEHTISNISKNPNDPATLIDLDLVTPVSWLQKTERAFNKKISNSKEGKQGKKFVKANHPNLTGIDPDAIAMMEEHIKAFGKRMKMKKMKVTPPRELGFKAKFKDEQEMVDFFNKI